MVAQRQKVRKIVQAYKKSLERLGLHIEKIILYGSYAYGHPQKYSDIDLIVVSEDFSRMNVRERAEILGEGVIGVMEPIEARGYTKKELMRVSPLNFLSEALRAGIVMN